MLDIDLLEAVTAAAAHDVVFMDMRLPGLNGLDATAIPGTGVGGRITREDVLGVLDARAGGAPAAPAAPAAAPAAPAAPVAAAPAPAAAPVLAGQGDSVVALSNIRLRTGEHMVRSLATSPHAITAIDVDFEAVERARRAQKEQFKTEEGFSLTYLPFIARAVVDALAEFPHMNATVGERDLIVHHAVNLSIAVDLNFEGLLAPVIQGADGKRLRAIAREVNDLATRERRRAADVLKALDSFDAILGGLARAEGELLAAASGKTSEKEALSRVFAAATGVLAQIELLRALSARRD